MGIGNHPGPHLPETTGRQGQGQDIRQVTAARDQWGGGGDNSYCGVLCQGLPDVRVTCYGDPQLYCGVQVKNQGPSDTCSIVVTYGKPVNTFCLPLASVRSVYCTVTSEVRAGTLGSEDGQIPTDILSDITYHYSWRRVVHPSPPISGLEYTSRSLQVHRARIGRSLALSLGAHVRCTGNICAKNARDRARDHWRRGTN